MNAPRGLHAANHATGPRTTAAAAFLRTLKARGVDYLFGNAGTDFASIIEAYAAHRGGDDLPRPVTVPHENLAVAMAHGLYLATGKPQAVMVHVNVGTANALCGLINGARENLPLLLCAGRTPITEEGALGSRNAFIHWGQEMFDQAAMLREVVKWDYELRRPEQAAAVVDRGLAIAMSAPRGPVYLTLPREVLAEQAPLTLPAATAPTTDPLPDPAAIDLVATWLAEAERPVVITASLGREAKEVRALADFAQRHAVPVIAHRTRYMALPTGHPAFLGHEPGAHVTEADLILVVACDVPWIPRHHQPPAGARVVHIGVDPLFARYPLRGFRTDLSILGAPARVLDALTAAGKAEPALLRQRALRLEAGRRAFEARCRAVAAPQGACSAAWVARCIGATQRPGDVVVAETALPAALLELSEPGSYFAAPSAGGLGWGLGAALGIKLGRRASRVITVVGDGAYMFGNPTPAHFVAEAMDLPTLTIILNNRMWAAVRRATLALYPAGDAAAANDSAFTYLEPSPAYEKIAAASRGYGERVERAADLPAALARALHAVEGEGRAAVLNVLVDYTDEDARRDAKG